MDDPIPSYKLSKQYAQNLITNALEKEGWKVSTRGLPDAIVSRGNTVRFVIFLPYRRTRPTLKQLETAAYLAAAGIEVEYLRVTWIPDAPPKAHLSSTPRRL